MSQKVQNDINGILVLDKPSGISSAKAIAKVKGILAAKKIGHAGTLDPAATGILVCLLGRATKLATVFQGGTKVYEGILYLGVKTDSDDMDGQIIEQSSVAKEAITDAVLTEHAKAFIGQVSQIPPQISAIKINGNRAYELVRDKGQKVALEPRQVTVEECSFILDSEHLATIENVISVRYRVKCSSGTYIRSIARDLGDRIGCGGAVATLRRTYTHPFSIEQSVNMEHVNESAIIGLDRFDEKFRVVSSI